MYSNIPPVKTYAEDDTIKMHMGYDTFGLFLATHIGLKYVSKSIL